MIVVDTGPLVAAALTKDNHHQRCVEFFNSVALASQSFVIPAPIVTEVCYLLEREAGSRVEAAFLRSLSNGDFTLADLSTSDLDRMAVLVDTYDDLPLGAADASVLAVAERLGTDQIATLDRRHFNIVRPRHVTVLTLLP